MASPQSPYGPRSAVLEFDEKIGQYSLTHAPDGADEILLRIKAADLNGENSQPGFEGIMMLRFCMWLASPCFPKSCPPNIEDVIKCLGDVSTDDLKRFATG